MTEGNYRVSYGLLFGKEDALQRVGADAALTMMSSTGTGNGGEKDDARLRFPVSL